jgi:hypothetical protein
VIHRLVRRLAGAGHADEWRAPVVDVLRELEQAVRDQAPDGRVHALPGQPHAPGDLRHGERAV